MTVSPQSRLMASCFLSLMKFMAAIAVSRETGPSAPGSNPRRLSVAT